MEKRWELKHLKLGIGVWLVAMVALSCCAQKAVTETPPVPAVTEKDTCKATQLSLSGKKSEGVVKRVVDGDTIHLTDGRKVRLIGVDTPETVHPRKPVEPFGKEASRFTREALSGKTVELVLDQNSAATNHRDKYNRLLAYVFRKDDGFDVNAEIIKQGYGHAYTKFPFERMDEFRCLQTKARDTKQGLWRDEPSGK